MKPLFWLKRRLGLGGNFVYTVVYTRRPKNRKNGVLIFAE